MAPILFLQFPEEHQMYCLSYFIAAFCALRPTNTIADKFQIGLFTLLVILAGLAHSSYIYQRGIFYDTTVRNFNDVVQSQFINNGSLRIKPSEIYATNPSLDSTNHTDPEYLTDKICLQSLGTESRYWLKEIFDGRTEITPNHIFKNPIRVAIESVELSKFGTCTVFDFNENGDIVKIYDNE